jgi:GAF domain-containing protein
MARARATAQPSLKQQLAEATTRAARLSTIHTVGRLILGRLSLEELLTTAVAALSEYLPFQTIALMLVDPDDPEQLVLRAHGGAYVDSDLAGYRQSIHVGIAGAAARSRRRLLINDVRSDPRYVSVPSGGNLCAELAIPIVVDGELLGLLNIESERRISDEDAADMEIVADQLGLAIQNARLFESQRRRAARVAIINEIGRLITASLERDRILQTAAEAIHQQLGYASATVMLVDPNEPETLVMRARDSLYGRGPVSDFRQGFDEGIIGSAARSRQRLLIDDVRHDPRYRPIPNATGIRSELAVPLIVGDDLLGVLNVEALGPISEEDAGDLAIVADQLSIAIDNARRYEEEQRRSERLRLIARVGQRITARLEPDELFALTVGELHERLGYDHVSLFLLDPEEPDILVQRARASRWPRGEAAGYRQSIWEGILGAAARQRAPELVNDIWQDQRFIAVPGAGEMRAELAVPIALGERLLGVLDLAGSTPFRPDDVTGLEVIAGQLAGAIEIAQLFARTQTTLAETRLLYETSRRIGTALDLEDVTRAYLEQAAAWGRYACSLALYETDEVGRKTAVVRRGRWTPDGGIQLDLARLPRRDDDLDPLLDAGQTVVMSDVHRDPRASEELRRIQLDDGRPAIAFIPLLVRGERIGLVVLAHTNPHEWSEAELHPYQVTAAQLASAIDSRRQQVLLSERAQQLAVIEERQRLARDLHDSVTQLVFSITLIAQTLGAAWRRGPAEGERRVERVLTLSRSALAELRALLAELRPSADVAKDRDEAGAVAGAVRLSQVGLIVALQEHIAGMDEDGPAVRLRAEGYVAQTAEQEEALYRIAQEALHNVYKHARANHVTVTVVTEAVATTLIVEDDGIGLASGEAGVRGRTGGLGLTTMRERAEALGGVLRVWGTPGAGATVEATLPRKDAG